MTDFGIIGNPSYSPLSGWGFLCLFVFVSVLSLLFFDSVHNLCVSSKVLIFVVE